MKKRTIQKHVENLYRKNSVFLIPIRYLILLVLIIILILPISNPIIYIVLTPITIYPVIFLLKLFVTVTLTVGTNLYPIIILQGKTLIEIVPACIAGAAYILLLILNLTVPMKTKTRIQTLLLSFIILLIFNILRIFGFSLLYANLVPFVDLTHKIFWYVISTIFIVGIWFLMVKIYKIKEIPLYSDIKYMLGEINKK